MTTWPGIDLVALADVGAALEAHGERYLRRTFTPAEIEAAGGMDAPQIAVLARTFAAKEALAKALRIDDGPLPWTDVELQGPPVGPIQLVLRGAAAELAAERRAHVISVTTTIQGDFAAAVVVAGDELS
jgi:holo-[acyl-carrier protein] synthase